MHLGLSNPTTKSHLTANQRLRFKRKYSTRDSRPSTAKLVPSCVTSGIEIDRKSTKKAPPVFHSPTRESRVDVDVHNPHIPRKQEQQWTCATQATWQFRFQSEMQQQMPPRPPYRKPEFRVKTHSAVEHNNKHNHRLTQKKKSQQELERKTRRGRRHSVPRCPSPGPGMSKQPHTCTPTYIHTRRRVAKMRTRGEF